MTKASSTTDPGSAAQRSEPQYAGSGAARIVEIVRARPGGQRAILTADGEVTVSELMAAVSEIASSLPSFDERPIVGVRGFRNWHWIAALLAIWQQGGVYMPLEDGQGGHPEPQWVIDADQSGARVKAGVEGGTAPVQPLPPEGAYLLPTSGSTGQPKWLLGNGRGLLNYAEWEITYLEVGPDDVVSQLTPPTFDPVLRDLLVPLLSGACLALPPDRSSVASGPRTLGWLDAAGVTVTHVIPTVLRLWCSTPPQPRQLSRLRAVLIAGEPLFGWDIARWRERFADPARLFDLYGPSETTLAKCVHPIDPTRHYAGPVPVGKPWDGTGMIVVDDAGEACPPFEPGEVLLRSADASFGYFGEPALTERRFVENPFDQRDPVRVFRTGDVGYIDHRGDLVLTGRKDRQHKVRGVRVDLDALEDAIRQCPMVTDAAVKLVRPQGPPAYVASYVVCQGSLEPVKQWLRGRIAPAAWPMTWQTLERLPTTASGKVDRGALPDPVMRSGEDAARSGDESETVKCIKRIWEEALPHAGAISLTDTFMGLDGQSIEAMHVVAAIQEEFGCLISLAELYELQTVSNLAAHVDAHTAQDVPRRAEPLSPVAAYGGGEVMLTGAQSRFWQWIDRSPAEVPRFQFPYIAHIAGQPDLARLHLAVTTAVRQSDGQPLRFFSRDGHVTQAPLDAESRVDFVRLNANVDEEGIAAVREDGLRYAREPFRLGEEPLLRARLYELRSGDAVLVLVNHVLGSDGRTRQLLLQRISELYSRTCPPAGTAASFLDYAAFEERSRRSWPEYDRYWKSALRALSPMDLPYLRSAPPSSGFRLRTVERTLPVDAGEAVRRKAKRTGVTVPSVVLGALIHSLAQVCELAAGHVLVSHARRYHPSLAKTDGCFTDSLVLPFGSAEGAFADLIGRVHRDVSTALSQSVPSFEHIVGVGCPRLDPCDPFDFPIIFAPQPNLAADLRLPDATTTLLDASLDHWVWPLEVYPVIEGERIRVRINSSVEMLAEQFADDIAREMVGVLETYSEAV